MQGFENLQHILIKNFHHIQKTNLLNSDSLKQQNVGKMLMQKTNLNHIFGHYLAKSSFKKKLKLKIALTLKQRMFSDVKYLLASYDSLYGPLFVTSNTTYVSNSRDFLSAIALTFSNYYGTCYANCYSNGYNNCHSNCHSNGC